jgi:hypothetical protein
MAGELAGLVGLRRVSRAGREQAQWRRDVQSRLLGGRL